MLSGYDLTAIFIVCFFVAAIVNYLIKHLNIRKHGWPPEHCDALGNQYDEDETPNCK